MESQIYRLGSGSSQPFSAGRMSDDSVDFRLEEIFFRADYRFCKMEADALREFSDLPTTTNMMGFFKGVDYNTLKNAVDIISWDNYPFWHERKDEDAGGGIYICG